jgi:hypothetical protein
MVRRAGERARRNHQEALGIGHRLQPLELLRRHEAVDRGMFAGRLQILADGDEIHVGRAHVVHHLGDLVARLAQPHHDPGLGEDRRIELLGPLQQAQRMEIARAGTDLEIEPRHGLEVVVEDIGPGFNNLLQRTVLPQEIRGQNFDGGGRRAARMAVMVRAKCPAPPSSRSSRSTEVMTECAGPCGRPRRRRQARPHRAGPAAPS